jgi:hypothetical protein
VSEPPRSSRIRASEFMGAVVARLADIQIARPWVPLSLVFGLSLLFGWRATHLELRTRYDQLLPENQPSVIELRQVEKRVSGAQLAIILLEGDDEKTLRGFGDAIVVKLGALGPDVVSSAEDGIQGATRFLKPRAGLFLDEADLQEMKSEVDARWDWEVSHAVGTALDEDDAPPPLNSKEFERHFLHKLEGKIGSRSTEEDKAGYYERKDGTALVVVASSPVPGGDLARQQEALDRMQAAVHAVQTEKPEYAKVRIGWAGRSGDGAHRVRRSPQGPAPRGCDGYRLRVVGIGALFHAFRALSSSWASRSRVASRARSASPKRSSVMSTSRPVFSSASSWAMASTWASSSLRATTRRSAERGYRHPEAIRTAHRHDVAIHADRRDCLCRCVLVPIGDSFPRVQAVRVRRSERHDDLLDRDGRAAPGAPPRARWKGNSATPTLEVGFIARLQAKWGSVWAILCAVSSPWPHRPLVSFGACDRRCRNGRRRRSTCVPIPWSTTSRKVQNELSESPEFHRTWDVVLDVLGQFPNAMLVLANTPGQADEFQRAERRGGGRMPRKTSKPFEAVHSIFDFVPERSRSEAADSARSRRSIEARARSPFHLRCRDWAQMEHFSLRPISKPYRRRRSAG